MTSVVGVASRTTARSGDIASSRSASVGTAPVSAPAPSDATRARPTSPPTSRLTSLDATAAPAYPAGVTDAGAEDLRRAADQLAARLPYALAPLARLAFNYRWSWLAGAEQ